MELSKDEKQLIKQVLVEKLDNFKKDEVKRDVPLSFLHAEEEYEKFLEALIKKF